MPGGETPTSLSYQGNIVQPAPVSQAGSFSAPGAGRVIATVTPNPGPYMINWAVWLQSGTPGSNDANNFGLYTGGTITAGILSGATLLATSFNPAALTANTPQNQPVFGPVLILAPVTIAAIAASNGTTVLYQAQYSLSPAQTTAQDAPLYPYPPLTANGTVVNITSFPANLATTLAGFDLSAGAECQVGRGALVPAGTSDFGFVDTTYLPTQAQILNGPGAGQSWGTAASQPGTGQFAY